MSSEFVCVPFYVERDGKKTHFLPSCRMTTGYRIGEKGDEKLVRDYWQALDLLVKMPVPRFRRPNANGNFGIVACLPGNYEDVSRAAIECQIAAK